MIVLSLVRLEGYRAGIDRVPEMAGTAPGADGPPVIIAHGFAVSWQLIEAFSLTLARAGDAALAFDLEGHGRNPVPTRGEVTVIEATTARLIAETDRMIAAGVAATGWSGPVALVGHSMASGVVVRTGIANTGVSPIVAGSMFSGCVDRDKAAQSADREWRMEGAPVRRGPARVAPDRSSGSRRPDRDGRRKADALPTLCRHPKSPQNQIINP